MTTFKTITDADRITGTSLQAYMDISHADLVAKLGEPHASDGFKVDAEWILEFPGGTEEFPEPVFATIYNYKTGRNYLGPSAPPTEEIRDWHIGGFDARAVDRVAGLFPDAVTIMDELG